MARIKQKIVKSILAANVEEFRELMSLASDLEMAEALSVLWHDHKHQLRKDEASLNLFLEMFNYQYNKYLIEKPPLQKNKPLSQASPKSLLQMSVVKEVFQLARERKVLAY